LAASATLGLRICVIVQDQVTLSALESLELLPSESS